MNIQFKRFLIAAICFTIPLQVFCNEPEIKPNSSIPMHGIVPEGPIPDQTREFYPTDPPVLPPRQIAEWEPMEGVLIHFTTYYNDFGIPYELIRELAQDVMVSILVTGPAEETHVRNQLQANSVNLDNCNFIYSQCEIMWTRDFGPWFIAEGDEQISIVDFPYHNGAYYPESDEVPIQVADFLGMNLFGMDLRHVGGNYMTDGMGVSVSTDMIYNDNYGMTEAELLQITGDYLGITSYPTFPDPPNTIGHIDCSTKFLGVDKIIIGQVPESDDRYQDYENVADYFSSSTSSYGTPYEVFRVYTPGMGYGIPPDIFPITPYSNSLIVNNKVFVPQTGNEWDDDAIAVYEEAMPGYEIHPIFYDMDGYQGFQNIDAIHCRVKGIPDRGLLDIQHVPVSGYFQYDETPIISAKIIAFSGSSLIQDDINLIYQVNDGTFETIPLIEIDPENHLFNAEFSNVSSGSVVNYYLQAADESGRIANHPYIGEYDPHNFTILQMSGDINNDHALDVLDIVNIVNVIIYQVEITELQYLSADLSGDGIINVLDIVQLLNIIIAG